MPRAQGVCPTVGCPELTTGGRCATCKAAAEQRRGSSSQRGYGSKGHKSFRRAVLTRDPICVIDGCWAASTDADHHPRSRRELVDLGLNPDDPQYGRGLCHSHHSQSTHVHQPGGWAAR